MMLTGMMQTLLHHSFRYIRPPARQSLKQAEVDLSQFGVVPQLIKQPVSRFWLVAESCCHNKIRQCSMALNQLFDDRPALFGQHAKFFAESSTQLNRKAGRVNLPQPFGLQWSTA